MTKPLGGSELQESKSGSREASSDLGRELTQPPFAASHRPVQIQYGRDCTSVWGGGVKFNSQGPWLSTDPRKWMTNPPSEWAVFPLVIFFREFLGGVWG